MTNKNIHSTDEEWIDKVIKIIISNIENNLDRYQIKEPEKTSVIFLAGAPWAWKTEFIKSLPKKIDFFFIDIDWYRGYFNNYDWKNSKNFQKAISSVVNKVVKYCFQNDIKFILDWTFKSLIHSKRNIDNCKRKNRKVEIYFIFQNPYISYYYTFLRELDEKRNIPVDWFIECFYNSIENIFDIKNKNNFVKLFICEKIYEKSKIFKKKNYKIYDNINSLTKFCNLYNIAYNWKEFTNINILKKWINDYDRDLRWILAPILKCYLFLKKMIWQKKQEK